MFLASDGPPHSPPPRLPPQFAASYLSPSIRDISYLSPYGYPIDLPQHTLFLFVLVSVPYILVTIKYSVERVLVCVAALYIWSMATRHVTASFPVKPRVTEHCRQVASRHSFRMAVWHMVVWHMYRA